MVQGTIKNQCKEIYSRELKMYIFQDQTGRGGGGQEISA